jgi:hypothetical protein
MGPTPEDRAARLVKDLETTMWSLPPRLDDLERAIESAICEAIQAERDGLRVTLRLCVETFAQTLALQGIPRHLRAELRVCRGLCLEGLGEGEETRTKPNCLSSPDKQ